MSTNSDTSYSSGPDSGEQARTDAGEQARPHDKPPLRRPTQGRMLAGVAAGLANYLGIDVTIIRIVLVVLAIIGIIGSSFAVAGIPLYLAGIPLYLACWLLIPEEGEEHSIVGGMLHSEQSRSS